MSFRPLISISVNSRADILGANIKAIEIFDGFANFMHQFRCRVISQYGTFTTAKVQTGKAGLVRHTLAEPQGIDHMQEIVAAGSMAMIRAL